MRPIKVNYEKIIYNIVFVLSCALIISQVVLTVNNAHIYTSVNSTDIVFDVTLKLNGVSPTEKIAILSNGDEVAYFTNDTISITVNNNSVLEIDGRKVNKNFTVEVLCNNKHLSDIPEKISVNKNIAMVGRFIAR